MSAVYFPSNKVSDSSGLQENSRVCGATRLPKPKTQNLALCGFFSDTLMLQFCAKNFLSLRKSEDPTSYSHLS